MSGRALIFVGIKHCGKSTQGKRIASHLGLEFFDTDDLIQKYERISPRELYTKFGKEKFMEAEQNACQKLAEYFESQKRNASKKNVLSDDAEKNLSHQNGMRRLMNASVAEIRTHNSCSVLSPNFKRSCKINRLTKFHLSKKENFVRLNKQRAKVQLARTLYVDSEHPKLCCKNAQSNTREKCAFVVATGGGICENQKAMEILKSFGTIVFLQANENTAADRIVRDADFSTSPIRNVPAYITEKNPRTEKEVRELFHDFFMQRNSRYKEIADVVVQMENASKEINTETILTALKL